MNFDFEQTIDNDQAKYKSKLEKNYETKRKKRRTQYEIPTDDSISSHVSNESSNIVSSFTDKDANSKLMTNTTSNYLSQEYFENNNEHHSNISDFDEINKDNINDMTTISSPFHNLDISNNSTTSIDNLLHHYTNVTTEEFCSKLLSLLRDSHTCKQHSNRLLSFIQSVLPIPNHMPNNIKKVLEKLQIEDNVCKHYMLCTICNNSMLLSDKFCSKCSTSDSHCFAVVYDMDVENLIKKIYKRLKIDIDEYRVQLHTMNDNHKTNDIGFNNIYQKLAAHNTKNSFITFLLHLDGISLSKSSKMKMWLFSGSIIELRPELRCRRYNMVLFSFWFSHKEPDAQIWLKNCINLIKFIKVKGISIDNNQRINIKFLSVTGDSPALRNILNFIGHGGYYCCNFCYIRGLHIDRKRQYFYKNKFILRDCVKYYKQTEKAEKSKQNCFGHKGHSILQDILDTRLPEAILIDYQHASLLRHTKTILQIIYNQLRPVYRRQLDVEIKVQPFPHFFNRKLKCFKEFSFIKAIELRNLLFYGFLPLSIKFVNREQLSHFALYVCSMRLYHSEPPMFGEETPTLANQLFIQYYKDHRNFYTGIQNYVLHLHYHYMQQYFNYGSMSHTGCFSQEDLIGHISSNTHGATNYSDLIIHYYNIDFFMHNRIPQKKQEIISKPIGIRSSFSIDDYPIILKYHDNIYIAYHKKMNRSPRQKTQPKKFTPTQATKCPPENYLLRFKDNGELIVVKRSSLRSIFEDTVTVGTGVKRRFATIEAKGSYSQCNTIYEQMMCEDDNNDDSIEADQEDDTNELEEDYSSNDENNQNEILRVSPKAAKRKSSTLTIDDNEEDFDGTVLSSQHGLSTKKKRRVLGNSSLNEDHISENEIHTTAQPSELSSRVLYQTIDDMHASVLKKLEKKLERFSKSLDRIIPTSIAQNFDMYRDKEEVFVPTVMHGLIDLLKTRGRDIYDFARQTLKILYTSEELSSSILPPTRIQLSRPALDTVRFEKFHDAVRVKYRIAAAHYDDCYSKLIKHRMSDFLIDERKRQAKASKT
ncbi:unnamed protein product [Rotaria magnacalcarata]|uniref:Uncharacterized protein n=1 Tax=Rotaria magnacalcarata TaxID=392030 RepID=A0A816N7S5_9BILA|nr:unnamed protein product [Rotaria magnacalcarata]CAF3943883.1 unnamed protein product [Rotaria magnacalcarata]